MSKISKEAYEVYGKVYKIWKDSTGNASVGKKSDGKNPSPYPLAKRFVREIWKEVMGEKFPYEFLEVSGNRESWIKHKSYNQKYFTINPNKGWQDLNHAIGHLMAFKKYPKKRPHCAENAWLEVRGAELIVRKYLNK